jgi:magnesium transporter
VSRSAPPSELILRIRRDSMTKLINRLSKKRLKTLGQPPGTLIFTGEKKTEEITITIIDYDENQYQEKKVKTVEECFPFKETPTVTWININGLHEPYIIEQVGEYFNIHPLILEDILNITQRPKLDDLGDYIYIILKMLSYDEGKRRIDIEQVSFLLGSNFVISFQEKEGDVFNPIRERIRTGKGRVRKMGADYLAYALIDAVVDNYFIILEQLGEEVELLEEELLTNPAPETSVKIHAMKRELIFLRRSIWPLRELIYVLERGESKIIKKATLLFLRDVYDHTVQVIDSVEAFRDIVSGMLDTYLSSLSNRMNEVMKVLTLIATIFIPLTFIAGIYGMNFQFMPELAWRWAYPIVWIVMCTIGISMLFLFKKKKWL